MVLGPIKEFRFPAMPIPIPTPGVTRVVGAPAKSLDFDVRDNPRQNFAFFAKERSFQPDNHPAMQKARHVQRDPRNRTCVKYKQNLLAKPLPRRVQRDTRGQIYVNEHLNLRTKPTWMAGDLKARSKSNRHAPIRTIQ